MELPRSRKRPATPSRRAYGCELGGGSYPRGCSQIELASPLAAFAGLTEHDMHVIVDSAFDRVDAQRERVVTTPQRVPHTPTILPGQRGLGYPEQQTQKNGASLDQRYCIG